MASDLISRTALIEKLETAREHANSIMEISSLCGVLALVDAEPTVEAVEVVHGEWIRHGYKWKCSACDMKINIDGTPKENGLNYCPNCGAKMDGKKED